MRDAYARVHTHLVQALDAPMQRRVILITSALAGDGKTISALQLGRTAAGNGRRVLLIDADLRRRGLSAQLGLAKSAGLSDALARGVPHAEVVIHQLDWPDGSGADVVAAGVANIDAAEALSTSTFSTWLDRLASDYDVVLIDSPPIIVPDAIVLSQLVHGVVVVVRAATTTSVALRSAIDELAQVNAPLVGVVLNDVDFSRPERYDAAAAYFGSSYSYTAPQG
jgi:capsular exopolysaccharide synthesis family protein